MILNFPDIFLKISSGATILLWHRVLSARSAHFSQSSLPMTRSFKLFNLNYFLNWVITRHTHIWNRFLFHQRPWHQLSSIYVLTYSPSCKQKAFRSQGMCTRSTHRTVRDFSIVRTLCVRHIPSTVKLSQSVVEVVTSSLSNPNPLWRILGQAWAWVWVRADI